MDHIRSSLCVALDGSDRPWIRSIAKGLSGRVGWLKLGLEAFTAHGPDLVREVVDLGTPVFLDLKLHDIPVTVRRAARNCAATGAAMFNVHAAGGREMLEAAVDGAREGGRHIAPKVLAVTVLTSLDREVLTDLGVGRSTDDLVTRWSELAKGCGLDGVVASAHEASLVRSACGESFLIVTPGIRPEGATDDDQKRVLSPSRALRVGADVLVIGRPITRNPDPAAAVDDLVAAIERDFAVRTTVSPRG